MAYSVAPFSVDGIQSVLDVEALYIPKSLMPDMLTQRLPAPSVEPDCLFG